MNELQKLNCPCVQVDKNCSYSTEWANVSKYKYLRITVYSEAIGHLYTVFSVDGQERGIVHNFKIQPNKWETFKTEVVCGYMKFEFVNGNETNKRLLINVLGRYGAMSGLGNAIPHVSIKEDKNVIEKKEERDLDSLEEHDKEEVEKKENRGKSPFRRWVEKKKPPPVQKVESYDPRLPQLMLRGTMLIATQTNVLGVIPPPPSDSESVLTWSGGQPCWTFLSELNSKWQI